MKKPSKIDFNSLELTKPNPNTEDVLYSGSRRSESLPKETSPYQSPRMYSNDITSRGYDMGSSEERKIDDPLHTSKQNILNYNDMLRSNNRSNNNNNDISNTMKNMNSLLINDQYGHQDLDTGNITSARFLPSRQVSMMIMQNEPIEGEEPQQEPDAPTSNRQAIISRHDIHSPTTQYNDIGTGIIISSENNNNINTEPIETKYDVISKKCLLALKKFHVYIVVNLACMILIIMGCIFTMPTLNNDYNETINFVGKFKTTKLLTDIYVVNTFDICDLPYEKPIYGYFPGYKINIGNANDNNSTYGSTNNLNSSVNNSNTNTNNLNTSTNDPNTSANNLNTSTNNPNSNTNTPSTSTNILDNKINNNNSINPICLCIDQSDMNHNGDCTEIEIARYNCTNMINNIPRFTLKKWNNDILCIRRSIHNIIYYFNSVYYNPNNRSNIGCNDIQKKPCIVSSNGNFICIDKYEFCPLTKLIIVNNMSSNGNKEINYANWSTIENMSNSKILLGDSQNIEANAIVNLVIENMNCTGYDNNNAVSLIKPYSISNHCYDQSSLNLIDSLDGSITLKNNMPDALSNTSFYQNIHDKYGFYGIKADFLEDCMFSNQFNPSIIDYILDNWSDIRKFAFYNIIGILALWFLNLTRMIITMHINSQKLDNPRALNYAMYLISLMNIFINYSSIYIIFELSLCGYICFWTEKYLTIPRTIIWRWNNDILQCKNQALIEEINEIKYYMDLFLRFNIGLMVIMIILAFFEFIFRRIIIIQNYDIYKQTNPYSQQNQPTTIEHEEII